MGVDKVIIKKAAAIIRKGGLVAFPTETVYGIAALPGNRKTVARLNRIKNRPPGKPYTIHIGYKKDIHQFVSEVSSPARRFITKYWPGPLTLILKSKSGQKIGLRMPDNKIALSLIRAVGAPVIAPSANRSGQKSPVRAGDVIGGMDMIIDGGTTRYRKGSTIVDFTVNPVKIVRKGCLEIKGL